MPPTIADTYPPVPLKELTDIIKTFSELTMSERKLIIKRLVYTHPTLNMNWGPGWKYRRCRKLGSQEIPSHVDELIWRKDVPAKIGRANPEGYQVLYVADRRDTALAEAHVTTNSVVISEFALQKGKSARIVAIGELAQIQRTGRGYLAGNESIRLSNLINACTFDEATSMLMTDAFLRDCLVGHDNYGISSHVALSLFEKTPEVTVVAYSSRRQNDAINFAIRVGDFWETWALCSVSLGHAEHLAMGYFDMTTRKVVTGVFQDGQLRWEDLSEPSRSKILLTPPYTLAIAT